MKSDWFRWMKILHLRFRVKFWMKEKSFQFVNCDSKMVLRKSTESEMEMQLECYQLIISINIHREREWSARLSWLSFSPLKRIFN